MAIVPPQDLYVFVAIIQLISLHMLTPVAVAAGNLWFVCSIGCNVNVANRTNHKFPTATPTGVPCEVKSTVTEQTSTT